MYTIERQEKTVDDQRQSVEWQQQILSESGASSSNKEPAGRPPLEQQGGPILNERGLLQQGPISIHLKIVTKIITKIITKNVMKNLSKSYNKKFKKSVVDTYLLFKLDFRDDFRDNFHDIFKGIELHPSSRNRRTFRRRRLPCPFLPRRPRHRSCRCTIIPIGPTLRGPTSFIPFRFCKSIRLNCRSSSKTAAMAISCSPFSRSSRTTRTRDPIQ